MAIMKRMIGSDVARLHLADMREAARELGRKYAAFAERHGVGAPR